MSSKYRIVGPEQRDIINPQRGWHDMRRTSQKLSDVLRTPVGSMIPLFAMGIFSFIFPATADIFLVSGLLLAWWIREAQKTYALPAKMPRHFDLIDPMELSPSGKAGPSRGTFYMGNDRTTGEEIWLTNRDAGVHMLVLGTTGSGKAQPLDARVHTPAGWTSMGNLKVGDFVSTPSGENSRISGVFPQGLLKTYRVTFEDDRSTQACADHLWRVRSAGTTSILNTQEIASLLKKDSAGVFVELPQPVQKPKVDLKICPFRFGLAIKNFEVFKTQQFCLSQKNSLGKHDDNAEAKCTLHRRPVKKSSFSAISESDAVLSKCELKILGLISVKASEKFIPVCYLEGSIEQRVSLLRGLLNHQSDKNSLGSLRKPMEGNFSSSSFKLAKNVQELIWSLGGIACIRDERGLQNSHETLGLDASMYTVIIRHPHLDWLTGSDLDFENFLNNYTNNGVDLKIKSIVNSETKPAQCIMVDHKDHLYITDDYVVTHNTEMLLGICQNALNQGSGFMFVDGKAQDKIAFKVMDLVRARGRDDDFMCLNFMTGAKDIIGAQAFKITNTMNPFAYGSSGMISQIVVGLMSGGGSGNDMWADRAISFVEGLSPPLVYMRDHHGLILDVNEYRKFFEIEKIEEIAWKGGEKYTGLDQVLDPLKNYLINLPGYDRNKFGKRGGQGDDTKLQHGYITMQLSRAFTSLADTYGHIVRVPLGEVFFPDLVKNRRILVVMLPSLEKTPSETANIGKIIVTALRNIMSEGLGAQIEGNRADLENEDSKALLPPYVVILDEYGYYAVKGFAVAFAQARSLGFVCIIGGQDLASFQKESKEEAVSICGNTRLKAFGSIEDPEQTMDFAVKTAGKGAVARTSGYEAETGTTGNSYSDQMNVNFEMIDRINPTDVKAQKEGQFHFVIGPYVIRAATYYVNPKRVKKVRLNHFVQVRPPDQLQIDEIEMSSSGLADRIANMDFSSIETPASKEINAAAQGIKYFKSLAPNERAIATLVHVGLTRNEHIQRFRSKVRGQSQPRAEKFEVNSSSLDDQDRDDSSFNELSGTSQHNTDPRSLLKSDNGQTSEISSYSMNLRQLEDDDILPDPSSILAGVQRSRLDAAQEENTGTGNFEDVGQPASINVFVPRRKSSGFGSDVFETKNNERAQRFGDALDVSDESAPLLNFNATLSGVQTIERAMGATQEQAEIHAKQIVKDIEDATRYPLSVPKEKTGEQVTDMLQDLLSALED